jgi:glycosyltransferase involved in cell wall biosynthesis
MKALIALPWDFATGGVTHVATSLARVMTGRGHEVTFLFPEETWIVRQRISCQGFDALRCRLRDYPPEGSDLQRRLSWYSSVWATLPQLTARVRARQIDLINVHYPGTGLALLADLRRRLGIALVVSVHGSDILTDRGPDRSPGMMRLLEEADAIVTPSRVYLESVLREYPGLAPKAMAIYNGFDPAEVPSGAGSGGRDPGSKPVALCIAAPVHKKGIDVLLHALHALGSDNGPTLRLVGDGPLRSELEQLSARLGLADRVVFLGERPRKEVFEEVVRCDMLVMPSRHESESFGLATLEAMACGKPVIASAVGGLVELVAHDETGLLVPRDDPPALAQAIRRLVQDPMLRARLGQAGRRRAQQFTVERMGESYEKLFNQVIDARRRRARIPVRVSRATEETTYRP